MSTFGANVPSATIAERIKHYVESSTNNMFQPVTESHMPTIMNWHRVDPTTSTIDSQFMKQLHFTIPRTIGHMLGTMKLHLTLQFKPKNRVAAVNGKNLELHNRFAELLLEEWSIEHMGKNIDRGRAQLSRLHANLFLSEREWKDDCIALRGNIPLHRRMVYDVAMGIWRPNATEEPALKNVVFSAYDVDTNGDISLELDIEIPWYGSLSTNNVMPIYNLRDPPTLDITLADVDKLVKNYMDIKDEFDMTYKEPYLRLLYYSIGLENFQSLFPFSGNISWHKPDWQHQDWVMDDLEPGKFVCFQIHSINTVIHTMFVTIRKEDEIRGSLTESPNTTNYIAGVEHMHFVINGDKIGTRAETFRGEWLLNYYKQRFFTSNGEDVDQYGRPTPIYAWSLGLKGHITLPGWGVLNFQNVNNDFKLCILPNKEVVKGTRYRLDLWATAVNIVTYEGGFMHKQLMM